MLPRQKYGLTFFLLFNVACSWPLKQSHNNNIRRLIELIKRRAILSSDESILGVPESVEDLPRTEKIHPGHTLLRPAFGMLKSSVKFPHKDVGGAVYGNLANLGITYGKTNNRVLYSGFRKTNNLLYNLLKELPHFDSRSKKGTKSWVVIELSPLSRKKDIQKRITYGYDSQELKNTNNNAMEILDDNSSKDTSLNSRRQRKPRKSKYRDRGRFVSSESDSSSVSDSKSSDYERNPGNPYTVHKDKYKQNWLWNHFMDGNHMNVNPYAPPFSSMGPSGAALFFGRKWWYYNQDDFKPLS
ncbi:uncharacterized protein LOC116769652 [Danaus plexippus]|uniref:uncharacterized protein LOC116769652 n=1 Tax=Danaus plexippus TaxID=13037 RepID=UPI002AB0BB34|nr:uncharacterized protein LOC116769652 [Danaus plexippus]